MVWSAPPAAFLASSPGMSRSWISSGLTSGPPVRGRFGGSLAVRVARLGHDCLPGLALRRGRADAAPAGPASAELPQAAATHLGPAPAACEQPGDPIPYLSGFIKPHTLKPVTASHPR